MKQTVTVAICLLVLGVFATSTFAGSALGLLRGYEDNVLEDEDFEAITYFDGRNWQGVDLSLAPAGKYVVPPDPKNGPPTVLISMWNVQRVSYSNSSDTKDPTTNTFTAISATKVAGVNHFSSVDLGGGNTSNSYLITFAPLTGAEWQGIIDAGFLPAAAKPTAVGSFGTMYDDGTLDNSPSWVHPDVDEATELDGVAYHPDDWDNDFATALGTQLWEFGFTGTSGAAQNGEFWSAIIVNNTGTFGASTTTFTAGLNETYAHIAHPDLLAHDGFSFSTGNLYQFELSGNIPFLTLKGDGFYQTDTDIMIRPTPEPASLALLALGLAAFGGVVYRRRRS